MDREANSGVTAITAFEKEVEERFGLVPNFFRTGAVAPGLIEDLWTFAKSAYLNNPLPSLFKERLFVYLSRFCQVRYCIVRHVGFLIGHGRPAGDAHARLHKIEDVVELLRRPTNFSEDELQATWRRMSERNPEEFPEPGTQAEVDLFVAANMLFLDPIRAGQARKALIKAIGEQRFELLLALLAFIQTAHYWTITHPDLTLEEDMEALLRDHEILSDHLLNDPEAERCHLSGRLFEELSQLRQERDDRETLRKALLGEKQARREQQSLINELNHRVKNTLAVAQSLAVQTLDGAGVPPEVRGALEGRLQAFARTHDLLTAQSWEGAILKEVLHQAVAVFVNGDQISRIHLAGPTVKLPPKQALAFSMATTELATNAIKYGALSNATGIVDMRWKVRECDTGDWLEFVWRESGGPCVEAPPRRGFGSRLIQSGIPRDLSGDANLEFAPDGVECVITAPLKNEQEMP